MVHTARTQWICWNDKQLQGTADVLSQGSRPHSYTATLNHLLGSTRNKQNYSIEDGQMRTSQIYLFMTVNHDSVQ